MVSLESNILILDSHINKAHCGNERSLRRLLLFVHHPEFFLHNYDSKFAVWQDRQINAAASLAGIQVNPFFFGTRSNALQRLQEAQMKLREFDQGPQARLGRAPAKDHSRMQLLDLAERYFGIVNSEIVASWSLLESIRVLCAQSMQPWPFPRVYCSQTSNPTRFGARSIG